jgi:mannitol-specific phosphotransferase system IIBC component
MAKEERGMQKEENPEKKQTREQEEKRETTWRTLRAFSLENKAGIENSSLRTETLQNSFQNAETENNNH